VLINNLASQSGQAEFLVGGRCGETPVKQENAGPQELLSRFYSQRFLQQELFLLVQAVVYFLAVFNCNHA
jgi:hypothetical protein